MNRAQLLEKLAMELASWRFQTMPLGFTTSGRDAVAHIETGEAFLREDWLAERERLINKPSWDEAPEWAEWLAQNATKGIWVWGEGDASPSRDEPCWMIEGKSERASQGAIPAGHDWRQTLEKRPITTSLGASSTACDDQFAPEPTAEEDEAFRACEQRIRDAELRDIFSKQARYQDANGEDWIDEFARTSTVDEFRGAMAFNIGKYVRRMGRKDERIKEIKKIADYANRWAEYEERLAEI